MKQSLRAFVPLILIIFIDSIGYMVSIPAFLRLFTEHINAFTSQPSPAVSNLLFSLTMALGSFGYMFGAPLMGTWSDSWGRRNTLIFSLVLSLIGFSLPIIGIFTSSLMWIFIGRFIAGIASSSQSLAQTAIADISEGREKAWYFALVAIAMTLSLLIGPTLGAYLSDTEIVSWFTDVTPFFVTLLLILTTLILTMKLYTNTNNTSENEHVLSLASLKHTLKSALAPRKIQRLFIMFFLYQLGWSFFYQDICLYLSKQFDYSVTESAQFLAYTGAWMALGLIFLYKILLRYFSLNALLNWSFIFCSISFFACTFSDTSAYLWIFVVPGAIGVGIAYPTIMTIISDSVEKNKQGAILGLAAASFSAPWGISAILVGPLTTLSLTLPLIFATTCLFYTLVLSLKLSVSTSLNSAVQEL